jgi:hypothetical protein
MQIAAADIGGNELQDDSMVDFAALRIFHLREGLFLDLHLMRAHERYCTITCHRRPLLDI